MLVSTLPELYKVLKALVNDVYIALRPFHDNFLNRDLKSKVKEIQTKVDILNYINKFEFLEMVIIIVSMIILF